MKYKSFGRQILYDTDAFTPILPAPSIVPDR